MKILANLMVAIVAALHFGFLALEMVYWTKPLGLQVFHLTPELATATQTLAANQGLYNGFLAAGLVWSLFARQNGFALKIFFLSCVVVAGGFGAWTANPEILFVQAAPGAVALALALISNRKA